MPNDGTVKLGVEFNSDDVKKAFEGLKREAREVERSLKEVNKALKLDPGNTELITEKQKLLSSAIENSKKQISLLASEMQETGSSEIVEKDTMQISSDGMSREEYDSFYEALTSPVDSHAVVVPYGQTTLSYEAYIEIVEDEVEYMDDGTCWGGLTVTFYAREPKKVPT